MDKRIVDKCNRKTPNFAYGNFSFQEKGFNMGFVIPFATLTASEFFATQKTLQNPNIQRLHPNFPAHSQVRRNLQ